jgi:N-methylhydantoinase B/oxoprolinase/acetone carboxylase alpha subunit
LSVEPRAPHEAGDRLAIETPGGGYGRRNS